MRPRRVLRVAIGLALSLFSMNSDAQGGFRKPTVFVLHNFGSTVSQNDVNARLSTSKEFAGVASNAVLTLEQLLKYDCVLVALDSDYPDTVGLGNLLAAYCSAGGGVVCATFTGTRATVRPGGNWITGGYEILTPLGGQTSGAATLGVILDQNHPILIGVQTFDGGSTSYRPTSMTVTTGSTIVAKWSDGRPLVAVKAAFPNRADLGFFPVSNYVRGDLWKADTDGNKLLVNALLSVCRPRVLIAAAEPSAAAATDVRTKLRANGQIGIVDIADARTGTPTIETLRKYDAVLTWSNGEYANNSAMGNVLADYVDFGGGVVTAVYSNATGPSSSKLGGRWSPDYEILNPDGGIISGAKPLGTVLYTAHPLMAGVTTFNGGSLSVRPNSTVLRTGGFPVVNWSDGRVLGAVTTVHRTRIDLGFYPVSSTVNTTYWQTTTDGAKLLANALVYSVKPYIAVAGAESVAAQLNDVSAKLARSRRFSGVGSFNTASTTPTAAALRPFHGVLVWSNANLASPATLGDRLADFVEIDEGAVVSAVFTNVNSPGLPNRRLAGRWASHGLGIVPQELMVPPLSGPSATLGSLLVAEHPIGDFVKKLAGGTASFRPSGNPLMRGRRIMTWSDGNLLASEHGFKRRIDLGLFPPSNSALASSWNQRTDGTWLLANAIEYAIGKKPCPGDFDWDGDVDDDDFSIFVGAYDELLTPIGDLNGDGYTDDMDFSVFGLAYNALLCP